MTRQLILWVLLLIVSLAGVVLFVPAWLNPGEVSEGHRKIEDDCFQCHVPFQGLGSDRCATCHEPGKIGAEKPGNKTFHRGLAEHSCVACHTDHQGRKAGAATREFSHQLLLDDTQARCTGCHVSPKDSLHTEIADRCGECHSVDRWKPATIDHERYFRFDRHHPSDCADCHPDNQVDRYTCYECHEHSPSNVRREHLEEGIRDDRDCTACHRSGDEGEAKQLWRNLRRQELSPSATRSDDLRRYGRDHDDDDDDDDDDYDDD